MKTETYDVVVVGGGAGGVAAAIGAAQAGARVALIEQSGFLGGTAINSSVLAFCGFFTQGGQQVVAGIGERFLQELGRDDMRHVRRNEGSTIVLLDRETTKRALDTMVLGAGVDLLLHTTVSAANQTEVSEDGNRTVETVIALHRGGDHLLTASSFVDASGDAVLATRVAADLIVAAPESRQGATMVMHVGGVAEEHSKPTAREMDLALTDYCARTGTQLSRSNAVCVRSPLTGELMLLLADEHFDALDVRQHSRAEISGRHQTEHLLAAFRGGLQGWENSYLSHTGPQIGVRETRRVKGFRDVTASDVASGFQDDTSGVAKCGWPMEDHSIPGKTSFTDIGGAGWYHISGDSLASRTHRNLWSAGRIISSDKRAYASVRVMGTSFATGHAAGVYAATTAGDGTSTHAAVRRELTRQGADV